jgi:hypothetical protein
VVLTAVRTAILFIKIILLLMVDDTEPEADEKVDSSAIIESDLQKKQRIARGLMGMGLGGLSL